MNIDISKKYRYRQGGEARILCTDRPGNYPVVSMEENGALYHHRPNGMFYGGGGESTRDLIEIREPREWVLRSFGNGRFAVWSGPTGEPDETVRVREVIEEANP